MAALWTDIRLALILIFFVFLVKWTSDITKSKAIGIILAAVLAYLTFYQHFEIMILVVILFFGYPFFEQLAKGLGGED